MHKIIHRPEEYTISVRLEEIEGDWLYVARVNEVSDIVEYADDAETARSLALDSIATAQEMCEEAGILFPAPADTVKDDFSGRITLRIPKELHRACAYNAEKQGVTLNHYLSSKISASEARSDVVEQIAALTKAIQQSTEDAALFYASGIFSPAKESGTYARLSKMSLISAFRSDENDDEIDQYSMPAYIASALSCR